MYLYHTKNNNVSIPSKCYRRAHVRTAGKNGGKNVRFGRQNSATAAADIWVMYAVAIRQVAADHRCEWSITNCRLPPCPTPPSALHTWRPHLDPQRPPPPPPTHTLPPRPTTWRHTPRAPVSRTCRACCTHAHALIHRKKTTMNIRRKET